MKNPIAAPIIVYLSGIAVPLSLARLRLRFRPHAEKPSDLVAEAQRHCDLVESRTRQAYLASLVFEQLLRRHAAEFVPEFLEGQAEFLAAHADAAADHYIDRVSAHSAFPALRMAACPCTMAAHIGLCAGMNSRSAMTSIAIALSRASCCARAAAISSRRASARLIASSRQTAMVSLGGGIRTPPLQYAFIGWPSVLIGNR